MTEWGVFGVIAALVAFVVAIVTPIAKLTKSITVLTVTVDNLRNTVAKTEDDNRKSHDLLWDKNRRQDDSIKKNAADINNHDRRIGILEHDHAIKEGR